MIGTAISSELVIFQMSYSGHSTDTKTDCRSGPNSVSIRNPAAIVPLMGANGVPKGPCEQCRFKRSKVVPDISLL